MAMIKRELIEFLNELVELASEENRARAVLVKDRLIKPLVLLQDGDEERRNGYGRDDFKKDGCGFIYHMEGVVSCGIDDFETVIWRNQIVFVVVCSDRKHCIVFYWNHC